MLPERPICLKLSDTNYPAREHNSRIEELGLDAPPHTCNLALSFITGGKESPSEEDGSPILLTGRGSQRTHTQQGRGLLNFLIKEYEELHSCGCKGGAHSRSFLSPLFDSVQTPHQICSLMKLNKDTVILGGGGETVESADSCSHGVFPSSSMSNQMGCAVSFPTLLSQLAPPFHSNLIPKCLDSVPSY